MILSERVQCPYCWEMFEIDIDPSARHQQYIEDCPVCCNPIEFTIRLSADLSSITDVESSRP